MLAIKVILRAAAVMWSAMLLAASTSATQPQVPASDPQRHSDLRTAFRSATVRGVKIFYREAGRTGKPTLLLLHGFPSSSHMYRDLLPLLAKDFHLVAPDYPGAGFSDHPPAERFVPSFDNLADLMNAFVEQIGLSRYTLYMQDFGGPVGFRMALSHPERVTGLVIQNANAYLEGIAPAQRQGMQSPQREQMERLVTPEFTRFLYETGARNFSAMDPTGWHLDSWVLGDPAARRIQTELMMNYHDNVARYPQWQAYLRTRQPKTLILWGRNDQVFLPAGARAYQRDLPRATLRFYDTGHFALEEDAAAIAREIRRAFAHR